MKPLHLPFTALTSASSAATDSQASTTAIIITALVLCGIFTLLVFLFKRKLGKIICACAAEFMVWLACDKAFPDTLFTTILTWITAFVSIVAVITIVNHIDWSNLRGKKR